MKRQTAILKTAQSQGRVLVDALADQLNVSPHTIRRDINTLCKQGKLRRLHGGAEFIEGSLNLHYSTRSALNVAAKKQIAERAAKLIPDNATLFFSIGTTPALVASALAARQGLTIITNNLNAAMALSDAPGARIILPGGTLRLPDRDILGAQVLDLFPRLPRGLRHIRCRGYRQRRQPAGFPRGRGAAAPNTAGERCGFHSGGRYLEIWPPGRGGRRQTGGGGPHRDRPAPRPPV